MKTGPGSESAIRGRGAALILVPLAFFQIAASSTSDYFLDEGQRAPVDLKLDTSAERQAEAMAHFITGMFNEETLGPEQAIQDFRQVLDLDPGYTKLAIDVAYDYLRRGDSAEAIGVLKDAIKARPDASEPALALSSIYLRHLRKPDLAAKYADLALEAAPKEFGPYEAIWEIAQAQGDTRGALRILDKAAKSKSTDVNFWLQLAEFYSNSTDGDAFHNDSTAVKISAALGHAAKAADHDAEGLARIGDFHIVNHQIKQAIPHYKKAAELKPSLPSIHEKLAAALMELGRNDEAIPALEKVIEYDPLNLQAYDRLAVLYADRGDYARAVSCREQSLIIGKSDPERYRQLLLLLLFDTGDYKKAADRAAEARKLFPQLPIFTRLQAHALSLSGENEKATQLFEQAIAEASTAQPELLDGAFYYSYGVAAQEAGHSAKAAELFQKSIDLDPATSSAACNALGYMWIEKGERLEEAEKLIRRALAQEPDNGAFVDSLGWYFYQAGRYQEALDTLLRASKLLETPDPVVLEHIGDACHALRRTGEAKLYWEKSLALDPKNKKLSAKIDTSVEKVVNKPVEKANPQSASTSLP